MESQSDSSPSFRSQIVLTTTADRQRNRRGGTASAAMATTATPASPAYPSKAGMSGQSQDPMISRPTRPHYPSLEQMDVKPVISSSRKPAGGGVTESSQGDINGSGIRTNDAINGTSITATGIATGIALASTAATSIGASSTRTAGAGVSDDDLTDTDESVMGRLAEFTEMARRTAVHNESIHKSNTDMFMMDIKQELSRELADEKRRVAHTSRKLEQSNSTCEELRESLTLAQDTVIKLREHEIRWAESTASEMSLRAEVCALKDEHSSVVGDATVLRKRCEALKHENNELGERFAAMAEEKRQVETRARRLLRSDRYRGGY